MNEQPLVEIFIVSRNRLEFVEESIRSALSQTYPRIRVVISDNSTNEVVAQKIEQAFPQVELRKRRPSLELYQHLSKITEEVSAPYFMMFHDDDILDPECVSALVSKLETHLELSAACPNAIIRQGQHKTNKLLNPSVTADVVQSLADVLRCYLDHARGVHPFPAYLYRTSAVSDLRFDTAEGNQYSDFTYVAKVARRGPILWLGRPLMQYRKHGGNTSKAISLRATARVIRFLERENMLPPDSPDLERFRYWNHFFLIRNRWRSGKKPSIKHFLAVARYFASHPDLLARKVIQKLRRTNAHNTTTMCLPTAATRNDDL